MLNLVPPARPELGEARELLRLVESGRSSIWALVIAALLVLALSVLAAGSCPVAGLLFGAAVSLWLCRYGPSWWPGRR